MTNNINGNGARYHLELLMAKNFVKKLTKLLETNSSINIFVSSARNMPKFQVITEGSQQWYECYLHYIPTMIDEMTSNKLSRNDAINILISIEEKIQHEIYNVQTQIHNEFLEASNYLKTIITYLKSCSRAGKVDDKIGDFIDKMPKFNYIGGNRVITCINQLCSREIGISEAIIRIQEVERSINAALRTV